ncbi:uncharacterized protein LOC142901950 isoform X2 [Nelusetta ayraudi]|uniref:uncharacterized protein LOC142901950 isoform X2 n=1 Tax=Nelusetta ayraudi TaxID=303726 RepID=UPI003F72EA0F
MSQPQSSADTHVLLQSMLQRLKIQQERGTQALSHTALPAGADSTTGLVGESDATRIQNASSSPVNGFGFYNGTSPQDLRTFGVGRNFSSPNLKYSTDGGTGDKESFGQAIQPGISPAGTAGSLRDVTSLDGTAAERVSSTVRTSDAEQSLGQIQDQAFPAKVYSWSPKPTGERNGTGGPEHKVPVVGNEGSEGFAQGKDSYTVQTDQNSTNSLSRRKQRPSGNRARRWTQKIKEKWRDRPGSFGKRAKEEPREEQQTEQRTTISPQNHLLTAVSSSNQESPALPVISHHSSSPLTQRETSSREDSLRCSGDFDFGLGSFSLLEEIGMGQEWAKFLNPNQSAATASQTPSNEFRIPTSPDRDPQPSVPVNHVGSVSDQLIFSSTGGAQPLSHVAMTQVPSSDFLPVSMDVSEGKQPRAADRAEPVACSHGQTQTQLVDRRPHQRPLPSFAQPADVQQSYLKGREHTNRKRQHRSIEWRGQEPQTQEARKTDGEVCTSPLTPTGSHMMEATATSQPDGVVPLHSVNSPPLSPASFNPFAPRKGVLKHSISQESESSLEFVTKRRRVEENRRVHFSEKVMAISPPELDMDTDSEEESVEEDSMSSTSSTKEQEDVVARPEGVAPARRPAFPAWILALKRRNTESKSKK